MESDYSYIPRLYKSLIVEVLKMFDCSEIFSKQLHCLNRSIYYDKNLIQYLIIRHLGMIEDYDFERNYVKEILKCSDTDIENSNLNYVSTNNIINIFKRIPRKWSKPVYGLGY